jgi:hypothetical protein
MYLRTEDGALFNTQTPGNPSVLSLPVWQWVRLEDGTEVLMGGPNATTQPRPPVIVRVEPGYQLPLTIGSAP